MDRVNKIYLVRLRKGEERLGLIGRIEEVSVIIEALVPFDERTKLLNHQATAEKTVAKWFLFLFN